MSATEQPRSPRWSAIVVASLAVVTALNLGLVAFSVRNALSAPPSTVPTVQVVNMATNEVQNIPTRVAPPVNIQRFVPSHAKKSADAPGATTRRKPTWRVESTNTFDAIRVSRWTGTDCGSCNPGAACAPDGADIFVGGRCYQVYRPTGQTNPAVYLGMKYTYDASSGLIVHTFYSDGACTNQVSATNLAKGQCRNYGSNAEHFDLWYQHCQDANSYPFDQHLPFVSIYTNETCATHPAAQIHVDIACAGEMRNGTLMYSQAKCVSDTQAQAQFYTNNQCTGTPVAADTFPAQQCLMIQPGVYVHVTCNPKHTFCKPFTSAHRTAPPEISINVTVGQLAGVVQALSRVMIMQQAQAEQRVRREGNSGITDTRAYSSGTKPHHQTGHTNAAIMNIHNHPDFIDTVGMGEISAALNGVGFTTRHNDYRLVMPHRTSTAYHATEPVPYPDVPPAVTNKATVAEQITEMREWFKAWQNQDFSTRDYRDYFKPVLCYLEGAWIAASDNIEEPFASDRHQIDANTWRELHDTTRFLQNNGRKNNLENIPFLPTAVRDMTDRDTFPVLANWEYRILCHPLKDDLPLNRFRVVPELNVLLGQTPTTLKQAMSSRRTLFSLNPRNQDTFQDGVTYHQFLDTLMEQIPGKDNYPANITDTAMGATVQSWYGQSLNAGYYSRFYSLNINDAMGRAFRKRSFNDDTMWAAMTTQSKVSGLSMNDNGARVEQKVTYAIPLEIIYVTPLTKWNPYNITDKGRDYNSPDFQSVVADGRNGGLNESTAYNGSRFDKWFRTPESFFTATDEQDPADTSGGVVGVLDADGNMRRVRASGHWVHFPKIAGIDCPVRQRYPIAPIHWFKGEGLREASALTELLYQAGSKLGTLENALVDHAQEVGGVQLLLHGGGSSHSHAIVLNPGMVQLLANGQSVTIQTEERNGHVHTVSFTRSGTSAPYTYTIQFCDSNPNKCFDKHENIDPLAECGADPPNKMDALKVIEYKGSSCTGCSSNAACAPLGSRMYVEGQCYHFKNFSGGNQIGVKYTFDKDTGNIVRDYYYDMACSFPQFSHTETLTSSQRCEKNGDDWFQYTPFQDQCQDQLTAPYDTKVPTIDLHVGDATCANTPAIGWDMYTGCYADENAVYTKLHCHNSSHLLVKQYGSDSTCTASTTGQNYLATMPCHTINTDLTLRLSCPVGRKVYCKQFP